MGRSVTSALLVVLLLVGACTLWPRRHPGLRAHARGEGVRRLGDDVEESAVGGTDQRPGWAVALRRLRGSWGLLRRSRVSSGWVADFAEVVSIGLEAGLALDAACGVAASSPPVASAAPWLRIRLAEAAERGAGVAEALGSISNPTTRHRALARTADVADLAVLTAAWRLSECLGVPTASVTATAARSVRDRREATDRLEVATSGPRTSMVLLSALPLLGPLGGAAAGVGPTRLFAGVAGAGSLALGCVLTLLGWWWSTRLLRRACLPARTGPGPGDQESGSAFSRRR